MSSLHTGDRLDHYRIEGVAARSGMASIFRAEDLHSGRPVAIKVPHPEMESDPALLERFRCEQEIGKKLEHPGVVKVLSDHGQSRPYIVMEWVKGRLLRRVLNDHRRFSAERATRIALRICDALDYIHRHGVIHCDLKPENIIIEGDDHIKLIDFGIASDGGARPMGFVGRSRMMGTPEYISPEQVNEVAADARSDLYALGVMLYEMLTGKVPFSGPNPLAVMNDRLQNNPVPPREIDPEIPPQLQEIIYRALERDPSKRYSSARELAWDLEHQNQVSAVERIELRDWKPRCTPWPKKLLIHFSLAMISLLIFSLLLYVARHC